MPRIHIWYFVMALAFCLLSLGCKQEAPAPSPPPVRKAPAPKPAPAKVGAKEEVESAPPKYIYNGAGQRDPFENPLKQLPAPSQEAVEPLTPLQKVDLAQLRIVGVIIGRGEPTAMVVGPGGKSFILKKGVKVGKNDGVVVRIDADKVEIREKYYDFSGAVRSRIQELQLPKRGGVN